VNRYLPRRWNSHSVTLASAIALLPALIVAVVDRFPVIFAPFLLALALGFAWPLLFAQLRKFPLRWDGLLTACVFVMLLPSTVPVWQSGLALSFGLVFGDLIFGERGRSFLNPATVGLAFLIFSFPGIDPVPAGLIQTIAAALGGAILLGYGLLSWRVVTAFAIGVAAPSFMLSGLEGLGAIQSATLLLGLVFLVGDPGAAACTNAGRWVYGGLAGGLVVLLGQAGDGVGSLSPTVFAALLASILAPLIDQIVILLNVRRRARRQSDV
jgi:Na+-transporting NADH:ubiquinone oxidoreductase subunit B